MLFDRRLDTFGHQVIFKVVDLLCLVLIEDAQRHIKTYEKFLYHKFLEHNLVEVRHQIWQIIKLRHRYLNGDGLVLVVAELHYNRFLSLCYPRSLVVFVEFCDVVQIKFQKFLWAVLNMHRRLDLRMIGLNHILQGTFQIKYAILYAFDKFLSVDIKTDCLIWSKDTLSMTVASESKMHC